MEPFRAVHDALGGGSDLGVRFPLAPEHDLAVDAISVDPLAPCTWHRHEPAPVFVLAAFPALQAQLALIGPVLSTGVWQLHETGHARQGNKSHRS